jgi:hypothetical protein
MTAHTIVPSGTIADLGSIGQALSRGKTLDHITSGPTSPTARSTRRGLNAIC